MVNNKLFADHDLDSNRAQEDLHRSNATALGNAESEVVANEISGSTTDTGAASSAVDVSSKFDLLDDSEIVIPVRIKLVHKPVLDLAKRVFDIVFGTLMLIGVLPLMVASACLVKMTSEGPVLFRQRRIGLNGQPFWIYKFRSMKVNSPQYAVTPSDDDTDVRVTRIGKVLRKTGLDELPQLFCVLWGTMSIVGPRPEMPFLVSQYNDRQLRRLAIKPGVTGLWQISDARTSPIHENLQYDRYYLANRSFLLDIKIVAVTAGKTFAAIARVSATLFGKVIHVLVHEKSQSVAS